MEHDTPATGAGVELTDLILIVVGAHLRAEAADRPLAYQLNRRIKKWLKEYQDSLNVTLTPLVCSDIWYVNHRELQHRPTISIGGPGVNALSAYYANKLSSALIRDDHMVIQLDPEFVDLRVCLWGVDHPLTIQAIEVFCKKYFDDYLRAVATQVEPGDG